MWPRESREERTSGNRRGAMMCPVPGWRGRGEGETQGFRSRGKVGYRGQSVDHTHSGKDCEGKEKSEKEDRGEQSRF